MPEFRRLSRLAADAVTAFHRLIAGVRLVNVPLVSPPDSVRNPKQIEFKTSRLKIGISADTRFYESVITAVPASESLLIQWNDYRVDTGFDCSPLVMEIVDGYQPTQFTVPCDIDSVEIKKSDSIQIPSSVMMAPESVIRRPEASEYKPDRIRVGKVVEIAVRFKKRVRRDRYAVLQKPVTISPTPWGQLDREFVVKCWEALREKASEKQGGDPGRDLIMAEIFMNVDLSLARKTVFDAKNRKLLMYVNDPSGAKGSGNRNCAIIIGFVRGTGKVLQVTMPIE